jgi:hypothetical protein
MALEERGATVDETVTALEVGCNTQEGVAAAAGAIGLPNDERRRCKPAQASKENLFAGFKVCGKALHV